MKLKSKKLEVGTENSMIVVLENSLGVQWLEVLAVTAKGWDLITAEGTKIPQTTSSGQKKKKKELKK